MVYSNYSDTRFSQLGFSMHTYVKKNIREFKIKQDSDEVYIQPTDDTEINVTQAYHQQGFLPLSFKQALQSLISSFLFLITKVFCFRIEVSQKIIEDVIPSDSFICTIGELKNVGDRLKVIPDYISYSKGFIMKHKEYKLGLLWVVQSLFGALFFYTWWERNKRKKRQEEIEARNQQLRIIMPAGFECIICFHNPRNAIIEPCKHMCVCEGCSRNLDICPVCRTAIRECTVVYIT